MIVTSAYEQYALKGYELDVTDYLLKPISFERFLKAVNKVHDLLQKEVPVEVKDFFFVKSDKQMKKVFFKDILFVEGLENYISIYTLKEKILVHSTMKNIINSLPGESFIQTHRSYIVNVNHVNLVEGNVLNVAGHEIPVARNCRDAVFASIIKNPL